ncbi:sigma-70 family RNA polymerase sigma factor [bacterium]|nr:sigma-70 family RNA polymerase sigma factor [bacterium]
MNLDLNDEALVEKFRQTKDKTLFKSLVRRYQNRIYNAAYRMLGNKEEAEEVVQDTFIKMHQSLDKFRNQASFAAWLFRISHNVSIDRLRARRRKNKSGFVLFSFNPLSTLGGDGDEERGGVVQQVADERPDPQQEIDLSEESKVIEQSLRLLPENQRAVLILHDIEGFSYQDIAEIIGANIGTVRSRLHYGRQKLKELLMPYYFDTKTKVIENERT